MADENGERVYSQELEGGEANKFSHLIIGRNRHGGAKYHGTIDDVYVYDRAISDAEVSHTGDPALVRHFRNAVLREDSRGGARITKDRRGSVKKIDAAVAAIIAHHRAISWRDEGAASEAQLLVL